MFLLSSSSNRSWIIKSKFCFKKCLGDPGLQRSQSAVGWSHIQWGTLNLLELKEKDKKRGILLELKGKDKKWGEKLALKPENVNFISIGVLKVLPQYGVGQGENKMLEEIAGL